MYLLKKRKYRNLKTWFLKTTFSCVSIENSLNNYIFEIISHLIDHVFYL